MHISPFKLIYIYQKHPSRNYPKLQLTCEIDASDENSSCVRWYFDENVNLIREMKQLTGGRVVLESHGQCEVGFLKHNDTMTETEDEPRIA